MKKESKPKVIKPKEKSIEVETIKAEKIVFNPKPKYQILTTVPLPDGYVRCIVLVDHKGMLDDLYRGDIVDLPERRVKSLAFRGLVKRYEGNEMPNKRR